MFTWDHNVLHVMQQDFRLRTKIIHSSPSQAWGHLEESPRELSQGEGENTMNKSL